MDDFGGFGFGDMRKNVKKRRSARHRQPLDDSQFHLDCREYSSLSSTPLSDSTSKASSEENAGHVANRRKELSLNQYISGASYTNLSEAETVQKMSDGGRLGGSNESGVGKLKKVKLKVGGVTHTVLAKSVSESSSLAGSSSTKSSHPSDSYHTQHKPTRQDSPDEGRSTYRDQGSRLRGIPWKDFSKSGFIFRNMDTSLGRMPEQSVDIKQLDVHQSARKSKRVPKSRSLGEVFDDGEEDDDDEIQYLEKLRTSRLASNYGAENEDEDEVRSKKQQIISRISNSEVYNYNGDLRHNYSRSDKESMLPRSGRASEDNDYFEEEESLSDDEPEPKKKKLSKEIDVSGDFEKEMAVTTRQRALKRGKAISMIEFPNGLPPAPPKKQKEKLSEVEQHLKKAEAAQRRRMQVEKAAQQAEAEAIRRILGQDSSRKKQEEKLKKRQEELAQERAANSVLSSNAVRWVIGPLGTTVTFPDEIGLPSIFESKHCSYPPPREKCAGPSCTNSYKYRDSKSKLPLCSLQCYKAINDKMQTLAAC